MKSDLSKVDWSSIEFDGDNWADLYVADGYDLDGTRLSTEMLDAINEDSTFVAELWCEIKYGTKFGGT